MSEFQPITGLVGRLPTTYGQETQAPGSMGKDDFLKLMITQLNYQDPMNPMDATEFSSQLAQFTTVEELQNLNIATEQGLSADIMLAQSINNTLASTLIGKEVKAYGGNVELKAGEASDIAFDLDNPVQDLTLTLRDSSGSIVRTLQLEDLPAGEGAFSWDGRDESGAVLPDGMYTAELNATDTMGTTGAVPVYLIGRVEGVQYSSSGAVLRVNGQTVDFGDVLEIREPGDDGGFWSTLGLGGEGG